jgi:hypothetical protein
MKQDSKTLQRSAPRPWSSQRSGHQVAMVAMFLASSECLAFSPTAPLGRPNYQFRTTTTTSLLLLRGRRRDTWESFVNKDLNFEEGGMFEKLRIGKEKSKDPEEKSNWMGWMQTGTRVPRGVAEVKMRDPLELGGIPRSDRYSSR